eukprot:5606624-Alexandrium_andersonii.AAC.1
MAMAPFRPATRALPLSVGPGDAPRGACDASQATGGKGVSPFRTSRMRRRKVAPNSSGRQRRRKAPRGPA